MEGQNNQQLLGLFCQQKVIKTEKIQPRPLVHDNCVIEFGMNNKLGHSELHCSVGADVVKNDKDGARNLGRRVYIDPLAGYRQATKQILMGLEATQTK